MITEARIATTSNITLSGAQTLQDVSLAVGDVVLVAGQTAGADNGPYVVQSGAWTRHTDHDTAAEFVKPWEIFIREGTYENWRFQFTNATAGLPPTLGTTVLNFSPLQRDAVLVEGGGIDIDEGANSIGLPSQPDAAGDLYAGLLRLTHTDQGVASRASTNEQRRAYIEGFVPSWNSGSFPSGAPTLTAGAAWIDQTSAVVEVPIDGAASYPGIFAASLHYIYLGGDGIARADNIAPGSAYFGTARSDSGGGASRYLCPLRANNAGTAFYNFQATLLSDKRLLITYLEDTTASPFRVVSAAAATTNQTVNLGPSGLKLVPASCKMVYLRVQVNATAGVYIDNSEASTSPAAGTGQQRLTINVRGDVLLVALDSNQSFRWANDAAGGSTSIDVLGFIDRR